MKPIYLIIVFGLMFLVATVHGQNKDQRPTDQELKIALDYFEQYGTEKSLRLCEKKIDPAAKRASEVARQWRDELIKFLADKRRVSQPEVRRAIVRVEFWRQDKGAPAQAEVDEYFRTTY